MGQFERIFLIVREQDRPTPTHILLIGPDDGRELHTLWNCDRARVTMVESVDYLASFLKRDNPHRDVIHATCAEKSRRAKFYLANPTYFSGLDDPGDLTRSISTVQTTTVRALTRKMKPCPQMLMISAGANGLNILRGADLEHHPTILIRVAPEDLPLLGAPITETTRYLKDQGYRELFSMALGYQFLKDAGAQVGDVRYTLFQQPVKW